jgi:hypothetical protein
MLQVPVLGNGEQNRSDGLTPGSLGAMVYEEPPESLLRLCRITAGGTAGRLPRTVARQP